MKLTKKSKKVTLIHLSQLFQASRRLELFCPLVNSVNSVKCIRPCNLQLICRTTWNFPLVIFIRREVLISKKLIHTKYSGLCPATLVCLSKGEGIRKETALSNYNKCFLPCIESRFIFRFTQIFLGKFRILRL